MKALFPGYYHNSNEEHDEIWKNAIFIFDTSVLLKIPQLDQTGQDRFFEILQGLKDHIWLPYQFAEEYHRNRYNALEGQFKIYSDWQNQIEGINKKLSGMKEILDGIEELRDLVKRSLEILSSVNQKRERLLSDDIVTQRLNSVFEDRIGQPYSDEELEILYTTIEQRYKNEVPPGYKDADTKDAPRKYGDAIAWFQIIEYARQIKKNIILVTNENKEDWWMPYSKNTVNLPRIELKQELMNKSCVYLDMHKYDSFLKRAEEFLGLTKKPEVIKEAEEIVRQEELRQAREAEMVEAIRILNPEPIREPVLTDSRITDLTTALNRSRAAGSESALSALVRAAGSESTLSALVRAAGSESALSVLARAAGLTTDPELIRRAEAARAQMAAMIHAADPELTRRAEAVMAPRVDPELIKRAEAARAQMAEMTQAADPELIRRAQMADPELIRRAQMADPEMTRRVEEAAATARDTKAAEANQRQRRQKKAANDTTPPEGNPEGT